MVDYYVSRLIERTWRDLQIDLTPATAEFLINEAGAPLHDIRLGELVELLETMDLVRFK